MQIFHMIDVIPLLGLPYPPSGRSSYYVPCPYCDTGKRSKHLNINLQMDVFRCPRCGIKGGIFDMYSLFSGIPRDKARKAIASQITISGNATNTKRYEYSVPKNEESPLADIDTRHEVYTALLSKLSLANDHRTNLHERGFLDEEIEYLGYKTTPAIGTKALAKQLTDAGLNLAGVPGFYMTDDDSWAFAHEQRGILVPVRDMNGKIQGMQIRRDNVQKRKFRWVSSGEKKEGCSCSGWTHIAGGVNSLMLLTEGPMKADVIHTLTGFSVIAVPGVNSLTQLKLSLEQLKKEGLTEIKTAFDMDFLTNWHVQNGYNSLLMLLGEMGLKFGTYIWDAKYKGLDDYIWKYLYKEERPIPDVV